LLVQSLAVPKPDGSLSAVVVSGGKQYRVAPGDRILVDRLTAEPGSSLRLGRVLLFNDGKEIKIGAPVIDGIDVEAKVLAHRKGPRIESIRYKSKKRVRVHRGGRADLTALEILTVGGIGVEKETATETKTEAKPKARAKAAPRKAEVQAEAAPAEEKVEEKKEAPKRTARRSKKETE
jgi:large subunit ribosomal protein L21